MEGIRLKTKILFYGNILYRWLEQYSVTQKETQKHTKTIWSVGGMVTARNKWIGLWKYNLLMLEQYSVAQKTKTHNVNLQRWWKDYSSKPNHCFVVIYYTDNFSNILWMWKWMWNNHDRLSIKIPCGPGRPLAPCGPSCPGSPFSPLSPPGPFPPAPPLFPIFCQYKNINYQ